MSKKSERVCPVERAGHLDTRWRRWLQNPQKILGPYVNEGMTVLDMGCGPGYFSIELARMVGESGRMIACDLQQGMLDKLEEKIRGTGLEQVITPYKCEEDRVGLDEQVDFILAFYMVHEVPDQGRFFREMASLLGEKGRLLVVEPSFHVSKKKFAASLEQAREAGLLSGPGPKLFLNRSAVLTLGGRAAPSAGGER